MSAPTCARTSRICCRFTTSARCATRSSPHVDRHAHPMRGRRLSMPCAERQRVAGRRRRSSTAVTAILRRGFWYIRYQSRRRQIAVPTMLADIRCRAPATEESNQCPRSRERVGQRSRWSLQPLSTNVSFQDQAYAALKQAIMDADIYSHSRGVAARRAPTVALARRVADADPRGDDAARAGRLPAHACRAAASSSSARPSGRSSR